MTSRDILFSLSHQVQRFQAAQDMAALLIGAYYRLSEVIHTGNIKVMANTILKQLYKLTQNAPELLLRYWQQKLVAYILSVTWICK